MDKWLWAIRVYKTRGDAAEACRLGHVQVNEQAVKPARDVRVGETVAVRQGVVHRTLVVKGLPRSRVGAALVREYCEETTPPGEWAKAEEQRVQHLLARERGTGRPTKRDRRTWEQAWGD